MSDGITDLVQRLASSTAASTSDILDAVSALKTSDALLPEPWSEEAIARALPTIVEMAARGATSVRAVAAAVRVAARPEEESTS